MLIATPANYDYEKNKFDTSSIENVINTLLPINRDALIIINQQC